MNKIPSRHYKISTNNLERKLVNSHDVNTIVPTWLFLSAVHVFIKQLGIDK